MSDVSVLVGDPDPQSRTREVAEAMTQAIIEELSSVSIGFDTIDLAEQSHPHVVAAGTRLLVVASPAVHGTYSGVLKLFVDGLPANALDGVIALPVAVAIEVADVEATSEDLARLLERLGAQVPAAVGVQEAELNDIAGVAAASASSVAQVLDELL